MGSAAPFITRVASGGGAATIARLDSGGQTRRAHPTTIADVDADV
jgi:hypothetical protein